MTGTVVDRELPSAEAADLLELTRDLVTRELAPRADKAEAAHSFPRDLIAQLGELGLLSLPYPEEFGGGGQPAVVYLQVLEELARGWATIALSTSVHVLSCSGIAEFGTDEQRKRFLPEMLGGATLGAYCLSESHAGSDAGAMRTRAVRQGDGYVITGDKAWITHGPIADFMLVAARTGDQGITARRAGDQRVPGRCVRGRGQRRDAGTEDGLPRLADQPGAFRLGSGRGRPADRRGGSGFPDRDGRARRRPAGHLGVCGGVGAGGAGHRRRLRRAADRLRPDHRRVPGRLVPAGRRRRADRRRSPALSVRGPPQGRRTAVLHRGRDGQADRDRHGHEGDDRHGAGARRRRLRRGSPAGAVHAGGQGVADRRGHQPDPTDGHRPVAAAQHPWRRRS